MSDQLQIDLEGRTDFTPGERVSAAVAWETASPPAWIELTLEWRTRGRGTTDAAAAFRRRWTADGGIEAAGAEVVELVMPPGPLTWAGRLVAIEWAFHLKADGADAPAVYPIRLGGIAAPPHD